MLKIKTICTTQALKINKGNNKPTGYTTNENLQNCKKIDTEKKSMPTL